MLAKILGMTELKDWLIIRGTQSHGGPTTSRAVWGVIYTDTSYKRMVGDPCLVTRVISIKNAVVKTETESFKLVGEGKEIQIPNRLIPRIENMTRRDWSITIQQLTQK